MTAKYREVVTYFRSKLRFEQVEFSRHAGFRPVCDGRQIPLPTLVRVSRGDGDLTPNNFGSLAKALGVSERDLARSICCEISRNTIMCGLAARLLYVNFFEYCQCRDPSSPGARAMLQSVDVLIADVAFGEPAKITSTDEKCLKQITDSLRVFIGKAEFGSRAALLREKIEAARRSGAAA